MLARRAPSQAGRSCQSRFRPDCCRPSHNRAMSLGEQRSMSYRASSRVALSHSVSVSWWKCCHEVPGKTYEVDLSCDLSTQIECVIGKLLPMIDIHSHLLPAVDDGARGIQESLALLKIAVRDGIQEMVLTPHIYFGRWDNSLQILRPRFDAFARLVESKGIPIQLHLGAEVHLLIESIAMLERGEIPFIGSWEREPAMLVELHDGSIPPYTTTAMRLIRRHGVRPIVAHPERNRAIMKEPDRVEELMAEGCLLQVTAGSLTGGFGRGAEAAAHALLSRGWVTFVATDAHNLRHRPPLLSEARETLKREYGETVAEDLTRGFPAALLGRSAAQGPPGSTPMLATS